jgi:hypothetical protein
MAFVACGGTVTTEHNGTGGSGGKGGASVVGGSSGIPACGNGVIDSGELCDGTNLGGKNCNTATAGAKPSGTLTCSASCTFNTTNCTGYAGFGGAAGMGVGGSAGMAVGGSTATGGFAGVAGGAGAAPVYNSCSTGDACALVPNNCCGYCSAQTLDMFTAVNARYLTDYQATFCGPTVACPPCALYSEPSYTAVCRSGRCMAIDVSSDSLSSCTVNSDCTLRWGAECCERCSGEGLTAVRASGFESEVCGGFFGCPDCAIPSYPSNARAVCGTDGHCAVQ